MKKVQLPVLGGLRKTITVPSTGTTIAEYGSGTVTLTQLKAALGLTPAPAKPNTQSNNPIASIAAGPGLSGGGPLVGNVPIDLVAPIPAFIFDDGGGGGDGDPGPPGQQGRDGIAGPAGPTASWYPEDGADGQDAIPGPKGVDGGTGPVGPMGPAVYLEAMDGEDGFMGIPGAPGASGVQGPPGPLFFNEEPEGEPLLAALPLPWRIANKGANWYSSSGALQAGTSNIVYVNCPVPGTIMRVRVVADGGGGTCTLDVYKAPFGSFPPTSGNSITASAKPQITSGNTYLDSTLTGWTRNISAGDVLAFVINAVTVFTQIQIVLEIQQ